MDTTQASKGFGAETKWSSPVSFERKGVSKKPALTIGEFLNKDEAEELLKRLRAELPVRTYGSERKFTL